MKSDGRLFFPQSFLSHLITDLTFRIKEYVRKLLKNHHLKEMDAILLIGGFAKSPFIREAFKKLVVNNIPVIEPKNSELCVVKGAVMFAWKRDIIRSRKSRYTYGFATEDSFIDGEHDESKVSYNEHGRKVCNDIFFKLVTIDEDLQINQCVENTCYHAYNKELSTWIRLFCSKDSDPRYIDDKGVSLVGEFKIPNSKEQNGKEILLSFYLSLIHI